MKKILAFLQNPWFKPGTSPRHIEMYRENQEFHRRVLSMSATGRALERALGGELYRRIHWDNACPAHGETRDAVFPPDVNHMAWLVAMHKPDVVLLFGRQAQTGWDKMWIAIGAGTFNPPYAPSVYRSAHPMARGSAIRHLENIAREVKKLCLKK